MCKKEKNIPVQEDIAPIPPLTYPGTNLSKLLVELSDILPDECYHIEIK